jgi:hypothetical protein
MNRDTSGHVPVLFFIEFQSLGISLNFSNFELSKVKCTYSSLL